MNKSMIVSAIALALAATAAIPASAQDYNGRDETGRLNVWGARIDPQVARPNGLLGVPGAILAIPGSAIDGLTTGSVTPRRIDYSAKGGNAAQQDRLVPQYGNTSGGPAE